MGPAFLPVSLKNAKEAIPSAFSFEELISKDPGQAGMPVLHYLNVKNAVLLAVWSKL